MWWADLASRRAALEADLVRDDVHPTAVIEGGVLIEGYVRIGPNVRICSGAFIKGPVAIGEGTLIGNGAAVRGPTLIGRECKIGLGAEIKTSVIEDGVAIGPQSYVGDSLIEAGAYFGAQVRTSNHRLDKRNVTAIVDGVVSDTGFEKLGCHVGANAAIGIHCVILPGRSVAADTIIGPGIIIQKNLKAGQYRLLQNIISEELS